MKKDEIDEALLPLLKLVNTFPWLLEVADCGYDPEESEKIMIKAAIDAGLLDETKEDSQQDATIRRDLPRS